VQKAEQFSSLLAEDGITETNCDTSSLGAANPEEDVPISVSSVRVSNFPLNSGKYYTSVYGQWNVSEPSYISVAHGSDVEVRKFIISDLDCVS
jgi:hypothetical protein